MTDVLDTEALAPEDRLPFWNEVVCESFTPFRTQPTAPLAGEGLRARASVSHLGGAELSTVEADPGRVTRTPSMVARSTREAVIVVLLEHGGTARLEQAGRHSLIGAGQLALWDTRVPSTLELPGRFRMHQLTVPHDALAVHLDDLDAVAGLTLPEVGTAALVPPLIRRVATDAGHYAPGILPSLGRAASDLVALAVAERLGHDDTTDRRHDRGPDTTAVSDHIESHLADPDLSPLTIAAAHHMSVRSLHQLFENRDTTVAQHIKQRRLDRARVALTSPPGRHRTVAAVAHRCGFASAAHFTRSFREAFGLTPTQYRDQTNPGGPGPD